MPTVRTFLLTVACAAVTGATLCSAGPALAQEEPVTVANEATGADCAMTNCELHLTGSSRSTLHLFGSESLNSDCTDELSIQLNADGTGHVYDYQATGPACANRRCNGVGEAPAEGEWPIRAPAESGPYQSRMSLRLCFDQAGDPDAAGRHCDLDLQLIETTHHSYALTALDEVCPVFTGVTTELDGNWSAEGTDIEVVHPPSGTPVTAQTEPDAEACDMTNCNVHLTGSSTLTLHLFGSESLVTSCTDEFSAQLGTDGTGHIYQYSGTGGGCTKQSCNGVGEAPGEGEWPISRTGETAPDQGHMTLRFCWDETGNPDDAGRHCSIELGFAETTNHTYALSATDEPCPVFTGVTTEVDGLWTTEDSNIEIVH